MDLIGTGFRALSHRAEIEHLVALIKPIIEHVQRVYPEALPVARNLIAEIFPETQRTIAGEAPLVSIDVRWLQSKLNLLGEKLTVDGDYGQATQTAVRRFQVSHMKPDQVDGWFGEKTLIALCAELANVQNH